MIHLLDKFMDWKNTGAPGVDPGGRTHTDKSHESNGR